MRILGIDPGYALMGFGILDKNGNRLNIVDYGSVSTEAGTALPDRLKFLYSSLMDVIEEYRPEVAAIEELFYNNNAKTVINVGQARGVAILACVNSGLEIAEYTPLQIKQALTGYGRADKKQVQQMVKTLLNLKEVPKPDDTADAIAVAICHANSSVGSSRMMDSINRALEKDKKGGDRGRRAIADALARERENKNTASTRKNLTAEGTGSRHSEDPFRIIR